MFPQEDLLLMCVVRPAGTSCTMLCVFTCLQEVFCTNRHHMVRLSRVVGKCCVLQYKDYCRNTVEVGIDGGVGGN